MVERRRFVIEAAECGEVISLGKAETDHVTRTLRLSPGDLIEGVDGRGWVYKLELCMGPEGTAGALILDKRRCEGGLELDIVVAVGLIKGARMDWAVEKAAELGARSLIPFVGERTVASVRATGVKVDRWRRIAGAALKQSLGSHLMRVSAPRSFDHVVRLAEAIPFVLVGDEEAPPLRSRPGEHLGKGPFLLVFGPEGSLSPVELQRLEGLGARKFSLGPGRFRTETAVIAGICALRQEFVARADL